MRFSERQGFKDHNDFIQTESMDDSLRNSLWNVIVSTYYDSDSSHIVILTNQVAFHFRKSIMDELPDSEYGQKEWLKQYFYSLEWFEVYDLLEFLVLNHTVITEESDYETAEQIILWNHILERENSGYRFIKGILSPITNKTEINEVNQTLELTLSFKLKGPHDHIKTAIDLLSKKPNADYRNSIKESISAIESICKLISKENSQGLAGAIKVLSETVNIHGALSKAFLNLYGFTSDVGGIRHSLLDEPKVGFDEAKYMLVSCSAFMNYLISKSVEAKVL
jgi:hypothetical protein